jgi:cytochrome P450
MMAQAAPVITAEEFARVPAHVPPDRIKPYDLLVRRSTHENIFETMISPMQEGHDVFYTPHFFPRSDVGAWVPRRARDLRTIFADVEHFTKNGNTRFAKMIGDDWLSIPTELDPPVHTGFRNALNPIFAPQRMAKLESWVTKRAVDLIESFREAGGCEFIEQFAVRFPVSIFLDLLGLPQEEMPQFLAWERDLLHNPQMEPRIAATRAVKAYLLDAIEKRSRNPGDDLISNALTLEVDGRKWNREEVFGHCFNLYVGGLDTVGANIGNQVFHLATHPDDQRMLREKPATIIAAVEELLRYYATVSAARICSKPYAIDGIVMQPGDFVMMSTPLSGRDPDEYENPDEIRFDRRAAHLSLGYGPHRCLGQHLARRELHVALRELLSALPPFTIASGERARFRAGGIIHVEYLPLAW